MNSFLSYILFLSLFITRILRFSYNANTHQQYRVSNHLRNHFCLRSTSKQTASPPQRNNQIIDRIYPPAQCPKSPKPTNYLQPQQ